MCPEIPLLASGHHRVAARTPVKKNFAHVEPRVIKHKRRKCTFALRRLRRESAAVFCSFLPNSIPCACAQVQLSAGRTIGRLTGFTSRQEQQLDGRCNRLNAGIAALNAEKTQGEAQTEGWVFSLFFLSSGAEAEVSVWQPEKHSDKDTRKP